MGICPLCHQMYVCCTHCPGCDVPLHWVCWCGCEWQSPDDWARSDIQVFVGSRMLEHRLRTRCGPALVMQEAQA